MWTNLVQSTIFKNVVMDTDTFLMISLATFTAITYGHFGILVYLIFEKRSTRNTVDISKQNVCSTHLHSFYTTWERIDNVVIYACYKTKPHFLSIVVLTNIIIIIRCIDKECKGKYAKVEKV